MVERGMSAEVTGDKGKVRAAALSTNDPDAQNTEEAMWAIILTKELWKKRVW
jgi:protein SDA1